jgi:energy-coupling factor transporter ATP-binding protein EcfA2
VTGILRAERLAFRYPQHDYGLRPTSLQIEEGEPVFVSGPSGSGKSTLARCMVGLIPHLYRGQLSGEVWLDELNTAITPMWQLAERAGLVFQNPAMQMLAVSVEDELIFGLENLGLSRAAIRERLDAILNRFELEHLRYRSPHTLSGGEQQKLALAAMMAREPPVLVLDEPLSMLDSSAAGDLVAHLADLTRQGTTVVVCEHRAEYLRPLPHLRTVQLDGSNARPSPQKRYQGPAPIIPPASPIALEVSGLSVELGGRPILQELSFAAKGGQVLAVVGRNGVGKTTLLRALAGLQAYQGDVSVNGEPPDLGIVFQNPDLQLFNASVRDEILYRLPATDLTRYEWLLEMLGLKDYEATPPLLLSEGEKKRLALATVLMRGPRHGVLLDEPALGQDALHKTRLVHLARALAEAGQLVIMTTHDLTLAAQADRLLLLGAEGLVADGPPEIVLADPAPWAQLGIVVPEWVQPKKAACVDNAWGLRTVEGTSRR